MNRRNLLAIVGSATTVCLSGCSGSPEESNGDTDDEPEQTDDDSEGADDDEPEQTDDEDEDETGGVSEPSPSAPDCDEVEYEKEDGTILISNDHQLQCIGCSDEAPLDGDYKLTRHIDASETDNWNSGDGFDPIGEFNPFEEAEFTGNFDGQGFEIKGLTVDRENENYVGLFGYTSDEGNVGATIKNIGVVDAKMKGEQSVGVIVGQNGGDRGSTDIENSYATGTVTVSEEDGGGLVGNSRGDISESYADVDVVGEGINNYSNIGGLVGYNDGVISNSYATGSVLEEGNTHRVGGLVGYNNDEISTSYATGSVESSSDDVGGLNGAPEGAGVNISDSYWDINSTGQDDSIGGNAEGLSTQEMTGEDAPDNMSSFDFETTWTTTSEYPELQWE